MARRAVAEVPCPLYGLVRRLVSELEAILQFLIYERGIQSVFPLLLHRYVATVHGHHRHGVVRIDASTVCQRHVIILSGLSIGSYRYGQVKQFAVAAGYRRTAGNVETVGIAVNVGHCQSLAGSTLCQRRTLCLHSKAIREAHHHRHVAHLACILKVDGIIQGLSAHSVHRQSIDVDFRSS